MIYSDKVKRVLKNNNGISILNLEGSYLRKLKKRKNKSTAKLYYNTNEEIKFKNKDGKELTLKPTYEKLYSAKMVLSLETYRAFQNEELKNEIINYETNKPIDIEEFKEENKELYSKLFVNLKFEKKSIRFDDEGNKEITSKKDIRFNVYKNNIIIDGEEYTYFKRGGSKARTAQVIFVKKKFHDLLLNPCLLGLEFKEDEKYDITSKEAYTSLIMSGIEDIIHIDRDSILIINDLDSNPFKAKQSLTVMNKNGEVKQIEGEYEVTNCTTDGQGLMDESIYEKYDFLNKSTCALLRNDFLKCNACRTKLQEYYNKNNIEKVWDMYRGWIDSSKIRLVITPNSCKFLKFKDMFKDEKECFLHWINTIPEDFGVVKTDHVGNYGYSNRLSYQMINSMNLTKEEVRHLMRYELEYINLLLNNSKYSKNDLKKMNKDEKKKIKDKANDMTYFLNSIVSSNPLSTTDMVGSLINWNSDYRFTQEFKDFKKHTIAQYIKNLRTGAIRIKNSLYAIMISCPYEMLIATHSKNNKINNWIMKENECYNPHFKNNSELISIRNPQINAGNIYWMKNKYREEYKWFGYQEDGVHKHDFVVFVNTNGVDLMNRLQGADFDIDTTFLCDDEMLLKKAKENEKFYTPTNGIKGKKELRKFNNESLAELDNYLGKSTEYIGMIVNKSAIFNAYMYDGINTNKPKEFIKSCYNASSTLSSYSQIAIDMAKKSFTDNNNNLLNLTLMMSKLNDTTYFDGSESIKILKYDYDMDNFNSIKFSSLITDKINFDEGKINKRKYIPLEEITEKQIAEYKEYKSKNKDERTKEENEKFEQKKECNMLKMVAPMFFKYVAQDNSTRVLKHMECGMDYLEDILDEIDTKPIPTIKNEIKDIVVKKSYFKNLYKANFKKIDNFRKIINSCNSNINKMFINNNYDFKLISYYKKQAINDIKELSLNQMTVLIILLRCFDIDNKYKSNDMFIDNTNIKIKELKDMKSLALSLLYNAYNEYFLNSFNKKLLNEEIEKVLFFE